MDGDGYEYRFSDFISENNGSKNDGMMLLDIVVSTEITAMAAGVVKVQGILNISDSHEEDGGFCLVPGMCCH
jgi:hypothetical protein